MEIETSEDGITITTEYGGVTLVHNIRGNQVEFPVENVDAYWGNYVAVVEDVDFTGDETHRIVNLSDFLGGSWAVYDNELDSED